MVIQKILFYIKIIEYKNAHIKFEKLYILPVRKEKRSMCHLGKNNITERIAVLVDLVKLVWNDDMFK